MTDKGALHLAASLGGNASLADLDLSSNFIGAIGASAIFARLPVSLTRLNFASNVIGPEVASPLSMALAEHPALKCLCLDENRLGPQGCEHALIAVAKSSVVSDLSMRSCGANEISFLASVSHLKRNTSLVRLNLLDSTISARDTLKYWRTLFLSNRTLDIIEVTDSELQGAINELRRAAK